MSTVETAVGRFVWHDHLSGDPEAAKTFYAELLGWDYDVWQAGEWDYPMIKVNEQTHGGFGPAQGGAPPHWLLHIFVDDVDQALERVKAAGGSVIVEPMDIPDVGRMVVIADPQGAVVSLFASAGDPPTSEGVFVWHELMTSDIEAAKRFYGEVVGWETEDMEMGEGLVYTIFKTGEAQRGGGMPIPDAVEAPPAWMTYIGTEDTDATWAKAESLGAQEIRAPFDVPTVGRLAIFKDPQGAVIGIFTPDAP